jgi:hypothetical protein
MAGARGAFVFRRLSSVPTLEDVKQVGVASAFSNGGFPG